VSWRSRDDGMVDFRVCLPPEEAAVLIAAITAANDQFGAAAEQRTAGECATADHKPDYSAADALLDVARGFLATAPEDRSGEDRTMVVVHVAAEQLAGTAEDQKLPGASGLSCRDGRSDRAGNGAPAGLRRGPAGSDHRRARRCVGARPDPAVWLSRSGVYQSPWGVPSGIRNVQSAVGASNGHALMDGGVVAPAQQDQIVEVGEAAVDPGDDVGTSKPSPPPTDRMVRASGWLKPVTS
jgi:Domain of unknown function (DUF222)